MKIQEGKVKYNGRDDIVCVYGETEEGKQYYFLKNLVNGNYIASTVLLEAIDPMAKASNVGVVNADGKEIIAFNNKSIKLVPGHEDILVAELATPISENVIEVNQLRNDPLSATRLVSTASAVKEKVNALAGIEGRYVCSDICSEATVYDLDGNNLVGGEYYSFINCSQDNLYLAKNTPDAEVIVHSLNKENEVNNSFNEGFGSEDLSQVTLDENQIVESVETPVEETSIPVVEEAPVETVEQPIEEAIPQVSEETQEVVEAPAAEVTVEEKPFEAVASEAVEQPVEESIPQVSEEKQEVVETPIEVVDEPLGQEIDIPSVEDSINESDNFEQEFTFNPEEISSIDESIDAPEQDEENIEYNEYDKEDSELDGLFHSDDSEDEYDSLLDEFKADKIDNDVDDDYFEADNSKQESIVEEVSKTLSDLLDVNKELENQNNDLKDENRRLRASLKRANDSLSVEKRKNDAYKEKEYLFKSELSKKDDELRKKDGRIKMVEASNEDLQRENKKQRATISKYEKQYEGLMSVLDTASEKIKVA